MQTSRFALLTVLAVVLSAGHSLAEDKPDNKVTMAELAIYRQIQGGVPPKANPAQVKGFLTQQGYVSEGDGKGGPIVAKLSPSPQHYLVQGEVTITFNFDSNGQMKDFSVNEVKEKDGKELVGMKIGSSTAPKKDETKTASGKEPAQGQVTTNKADSGAVAAATPAPAAPDGAATPAMPEALQAAMPDGAAPAVMPDPGAAATPDVTVPAAAVPAAASPTPTETAATTTDTVPVFNPGAGANIYQPSNPAVSYFNSDTNNGQAQ